MAFVKKLEKETNVTPAQTKKVFIKIDPRQTKKELDDSFAKSEVKHSTRSKTESLNEKNQKTNDISIDYADAPISAGADQPALKKSSKTRAKNKEVLEEKIAGLGATEQQAVRVSQYQGLHGDNSASVIQKAQEKLPKEKVNAEKSSDGMAELTFVPIETEIQASKGNSKKPAATKTLSVEEAETAEVPNPPIPTAQTIETFVAAGVIIEEVMSQIEAKMPDLAEAEGIAAEKMTNTAKAAKATSASKHGFKQAEFIVYPAHGVGQIIAIEEQEVAGFKLELFVISFVKDKMILKVPTPKAVSVRMRKLADAAIVKKSLDTLTGRARIKRTMWSRRAQEYEAKINSGDLVAIAEVVRDLYRSNAQPEQSYSERQLYEAALDRMAREIAAVQKFSETEAFKLLDTQLQKGPRRSKGEEIEGDDLDVDVEQAA